MVGPSLCISTVTIAAEQDQSPSVSVAASEAAEAPEGDPVDSTPPDDDGVAYQYSKLTVTAAGAEGDSRQSVDLSFLHSATVELTQTEKGWVGPQAGSSQRVSIERLTDEPGTLWSSAIAAISRSLRDHVQAERGWVGIFVTPSPNDIDISDGADIRPPGDLGLDILVYVGTAADVRTVASGGRLDPNENDPSSSVNRPEHRRLVDDVPVEIGLPVPQRALNDFALRKSRHPGRRVDVALAPADEFGGISIDLLVNEPKPWTVFYQLNNTGTESTDDWRHRFSFQHRQLTGRDDVLSIDYVTAGFEDTHAVLGSYEFPVIDDVLRLRTFGSWNEYTAADVGLPGFDFTGEGYDAGGQAIWTVAQAGDWFVDLLGGVRVEHAEVENEFAGTEASESFLLLSGGARIARESPLSRVFLEGTFERSVPRLFGTDESEVGELGRAAADADFTILRGEGNAQLWLDPLFGATQTDDPAKQTLSSQIVMSIRGQAALGDSRLPPTFQSVAGGFYTVRGYRESFSAGDNMFLATAEYRFHLGRALPIARRAPSSAGGPFRFSRDRPYGFADWDVVLRTFVDYARVTYNDRQSFERNADLLGAGVGIELQLLTNLSARLDYGIVARDATNGVDRADAGDTRIHFEFTALY